MVKVSDIKEYMDYYDIDQKTMAELLEVSNSHLSNVLNGVRSVSNRLEARFEQLPGQRERRRLEAISNRLSKLRADDEITTYAMEEISQRLWSDD